MEVKATDRSYEKITVSDLRRLGEIARNDLDDLFRRNQRLRNVCADRLLAVALCQGAALHALDGKNGIGDLLLLTARPTLWL